MFRYLNVWTVADAVTALSALLGVIGITIAIWQILRQQRISQAQLSSLEYRIFYSKNEEWRDSIERQLSDLNRKLTDTPEEFSRVNHLLRDAERASLVEEPGSTPSASRFLQSFGIGSPEIERDLIFVLTPFEMRERATYAAIVEAFSSWNVRVVRGDEESITSNMLRHIVELIVRARIVVANVSARNPNVMYELGIAHALGKQVIMIAASEKSIPFDLRHQRVLLYDTRDDLIIKLRDNVGKMMFSERTGLRI